MKYPIKYNCFPNEKLLSKFCKEVSGKGEYNSLDECIDDCMYRKRMEDLKNSITKHRSKLRVHQSIYDSGREYESSNYRSGIQICLNCSYPITSEIHSEKCITVRMWGFKTQEVNEEFKPMMTYGLGGCTAGLVAIKDDVFLNILLVHDPSEDIVKQRIQAYLGKYNDTEYESFVIIRTPEENIKNDEGKYIIVPKNNTYWETFLTNSDIIRIKCTYCIEPYSLTSRYGGFSSYHTTLHCKIEGDELQYSTIYGSWKNIEECKK